MDYEIDRALEDLRHDIRRLEDELEDERAARRECLQEVWDTINELRKAKAVA